LLSSSDSQQWKQGAECAATRRGYLKLSQHLAIDSSVLNVTRVAGGIIVNETSGRQCRLFCFEPIATSMAKKWLAFRMAGLSMCEVGAKGSKPSSMDGKLR
jgi:hypothetical protein